MAYANVSEAALHEWAQRNWWITNDDLEAIAAEFGFFPILSSLSGTQTSRSLHDICQGCLWMEKEDFVRSMGAP